MTTKRILRVALFGAAPDTPNMGVSALFFSAVSGIANCLDDVEFVVFDNGLGLREESLALPSGRAVRLLRFGARGGRRYHRPENIASMLFASRIGVLGAKLNQAVSLIDSCDAVLDVSGGDSFSDIYGTVRFNNICRPKAVAINRRKPLVLLPQTYGPFTDHKKKAAAAAVTRGASMAWARDQNSYRILKELLGEAFNPAKHLCGVDMAFGLPARSAEDLLNTHLLDWLNNKTPGVPLVGFNVSGLIYNDPEAALSKYGFKADYRSIVSGFIGKLLADTNARLIFIPHVMDSPGHFESDLAACLDAVATISKSYHDRIVIAPCIPDPTRVKWLISRMDWFCGTRMHATIAALSSGVPTAAVSYSDKTRGVFETCGLENTVIDPRYSSTAEVVTHLIREYENRDLASETLAEGLSTVSVFHKRQFEAIANKIAASPRRSGAR